MKIITLFIYVTAVFAVVLFSGPVCVAEDGDGGQPGAFLNLGVGVRALTLGKAYTALADDAEATYWNPAGLAQIERFDFSFMYAEPFKSEFSGIDYQFIALGGKTSIGSIGVSFLYHSVDSLLLTDSTGIRGTFGDKEYMLGISYAGKIADNISLGGTLKIINQDIQAYDDTGYGLDVGILGRFDKFRLGAVIMNAVEPELKLRQTDEQIPTRIRVGAATDLYDWVTLSADIDSAADEDVHYHAGTEFKWIGQRLEGHYGMAVRSGYSSDNEELSLGLAIFTSSVSFDYGIGFHPELKDSQRFGFRMSF
jgi:hypothetical protein